MASPSESTARRVPHELYRPILAHISDLNTIAKLMTVCSAFNDEAERLLYRIVEYDKDERQWPLLYGPHLPRVAPYVRCISFLGLYVENEREWMWREPPEADDRAERVFSHLKHVETFITDNSWPMTTNNIHFTPKLRLLQTQVEGNRSFSNFLKTQDCLIELDWLTDGMSSSFSEVPDLVPGLDIFTFNNMSVFLLEERKRFPRRLRYRCKIDPSEENFPPNYDVQVLKIDCPPGETYSVNDHVMIPPFTVLTPNIRYLALRSEWVSLDFWL